MLRPGSHTRSEAPLSRRETHPSSPVLLHCSELQRKWAHKTRQGRPQALGRKGWGLLDFEMCGGGLGPATRDARFITSHAKTALREGREGCFRSWFYPRWIPKRNMPPPPLCSFPVFAFPFPSSLCFPGRKQEQLAFDRQRRLEILLRWRVERSPRPCPDGTRTDIKSKYHQ